MQRLNATQPKVSRPVIIGTPHRACPRKIDVNGMNHLIESNRMNSRKIDKSNPYFQLSSTIATSSTYVVPCWSLVGAHLENWMNEEREGVFGFFLSTGFVRELANACSKRSCEARGFSISSPSFEAGGGVVVDATCWHRGAGARKKICSHFPIFDPLD